MSSPDALLHGMVYFEPLPVGVDRPNNFRPAYGKISNRPIQVDNERDPRLSRIPSKYTGPINPTLALSAEKPILVTWGTGHCGTSSHRERYARRWRNFFSFLRAQCIGAKKKKK